jgi:O-antigen/teichoic acid export membrane protein
VIGYSSLLDLGVGLTVMRMVAERAHRPDKRELNTIATTGLVLYGAMGVALLAIGIAAAPFLGRNAFHLHGATLGDFEVAFAIVAATIGLTFPAGLYSGINQGFAHYRQQNTILVAQTLLGAAGSIAAVSVGGGLVSLAAVVGISTFAGFAAKAIYAAKAYGIVPSPRSFDRRVARSVMGVSTWMFAINIASKVIWDTDNIVVGAVLNTVAVSHYTVALGPATAVRRVTDQFNTVSLTAASSLKAQRDRDGLRRLLLEGTRVVTIVIGPFFVLFALFGRDFLRLWVGPSLESSAPTLVVLVLGMLASSIQATASMVLLALERQRVMAFVAVGEALANVALSVALATQLGIVGVAIGTTLPTTLTACGFYVPYAARLLGVPLSRIAKRLALPVGVCAAAYAAVRLAAPHIVFSTLPVFCAAAALFVATLIAASMLLDNEERGTYVGIAQTWGRRVLRAQ